MSNRKQSKSVKPLLVADRVDIAHRNQTSEGKPWGEFLDQPPIIHGGPQVTDISLALLASHRVQSWETFSHARDRGVTVDRAAGIEVMGAKQPKDALWGFTVYPMAAPTPKADKPVSAKPKATPTPKTPPIAKTDSLDSSRSLSKPKARTGKLKPFFKLSPAEKLAFVRRENKCAPVTMPKGWMSMADTFRANRQPCSVKAAGFTYTQLAKSWNDYIKSSPGCKLSETTAQKLIDSGRGTLAY